jgi:hypothetical protein
VFSPGLDLRPANLRNRGTGGDWLIYGGGAIEVHIRAAAKVAPRAANREVFLNLEPYTGFMAASALSMVEEIGDQQ